MKKSKQIKQIQAEIESLRKQVVEGNFANNKIKDLEDRLEELNRTCCCCRKSSKPVGPPTKEECRIMTKHSKYESILREYLPGLYIERNDGHYPDTIWLNHHMVIGGRGKNQIGQNCVWGDLWENLFDLCIGWKTEIAETGKLDLPKVVYWKKFTPYLEHFLTHCDTPKIPVKCCCNCGCCHV